MLLYRLRVPSKRASRDAVLIVAPLVMPQGPKTVLLRAKHADCCVPLLLDTGAKVSLLNIETCNLFFPCRQLQPPSTAPWGYGRSKIDVVGTLHLPVRYGSTTLDPFPFHITRRGENIMGLDLFISLGFSLQDNCGTKVLHVASPWHQNWPDLFNGLGCLTLFTHKPLLDHGVAPIVQPLQRVPLALRDGVTDELKRLQADGIIEPIDASPWVSNLVIARKKSGGLRVCIDLREVPLHPESWNLTAFITHTRLYRYMRMPFGLRHHATLNTDKCVFSAPAIDFVGFRVSADGISPLQSNVDAIVQVPALTTTSQLASFLGMTAYYMRFLPQYSSVTAPLRLLLKQDAPWTWTPDCQASLEELKRLLTTSPILAHFQLECPTLVTCDASAVAVGAILLQLHNGVEKPVAFASRALSLTEQKYSVGEREALACIWAWDTGSFASTDGQTACSNMTFSYNSLQAGIVVADFLSRPTIIQCPATSSEDEDDVVHLVHSPLKDTISLHDLETASAAEPVFTMLRDYIRHGWPARVPLELEPFSRVKHELTCWGEACIARGHCAVIPMALRGCVLQMAHQGHLGIVKIKQRCRDLVWWPGIDRDLEGLVRSCAACLTSGKTGSPASPPLQPLDWPPVPWDHLQLDICGELYNVPHHQRFLVVVYDLHSKWPDVAPMGTVTSAAVTSFLDQLFARWGLPRAITTDNGPQFRSSEFTAYLATKGVTHIRTSVFHPQANGGVERFNQSLKNGPPLPGQLYRQRD
ncbi:hypothetical protein SKAU_G00281670 [Synaphobranchus kaupii]|uniref:Gypsy retrotransposon integrase-like protein 1 n=1 Tax=Synaphobranchus kaupii TaxID=118154 RepID=A0A9Q1INR1_SYNKA|nr:hypothetical protein SKAU_G00281670 [Synaphobranchus kaupii]